MNIFIIFIKFLGKIVVIWVRLARLIGEKGGLTTKMKYKMTKNFFGPRGPGPPLGFVLTPCVRVLPKNLNFDCIVGPTSKGHNSLNINPNHKKYVFKLKPQMSNFK